MIPDYDHIVVGSGIAGLTMTRLLALRGSRVLLLEKAPVLGGSAGRFSVQGIPFDIGVHFTGGFNPEGSGILDHMLGLMGMRADVQWAPFPPQACHRMIFPSAGEEYVIPSGLNTLEDKLQKDFPRIKDGITRYFHRFRQIVAGTPSLTLAGLETRMYLGEEDTITLQQVLDECIHDPLAQAILGGFCMCHGTAPKDISFASHCRICFGLHEYPVRLVGGGQALVDGLLRVLKDEKVHIRRGVALTACEEIESRRVQRFRLSDGSAVAAKSCVFTIHPRQILATLPAQHVTRAFCDRVNDFESSLSFFGVFGTMTGSTPVGAAPILTIIPDLDLNKMLTCRTAEPVDSPVVMLQSVENTARGRIETLTALEVTFPQWVRAWNDSAVGRRPEAYYQYKRARVESITRRLEASVPELTSRWKVLEAASSLTFRDYLHNPDGAAYGIKQKMGQFNVSDRLPLANLYAAGQNALLPGVIGAMTSSFLVARSILGRESFRELLGGALSNYNG